MPEVTWLSYSPFSNHTAVPTLILLIKVNSKGKYNVQNILLHALPVTQR